MNRIITSIVILLIPLSAFCVPIKFHFASKAEGQQLMMEDTTYYNRLTQTDIDWRMRKENASLAEYISYSVEQVEDFGAEEIKAVTDAMATIEDSFKKLGCQLPVPDEIVFIKTTMKEEGGANAYTRKNQIFLGSECLNSVHFTGTLAHELFHCISRHSPELRRKMYKLIGFTVMDEEIDFPEAVRERITANPDVERIDNYGTFTIEGKKRRCALVTVYTQTWSEANAKRKNSATFFGNLDIVLIPLDDLNSSYSILFNDKDSIPDLWSQVGENTYYLLAPEECMADNFSFAIVPTKPRGQYRTPKLLKNIIKTLKKNKIT